ncbi:MGMT family protein [Pseudarthrobacter sp. J1763]|uniref:MGMT family protein n=1 Tax=Pseudarthrobacter sp. J1763 TaxID=3420445 RepID=UPI003D2CFBD6
MREDFVDAVLTIAAMVPAGSAVAYSDISDLLQSAGPRQVGSVMSHYGSSDPWWRVLRASGEAPQGHESQALAHYLAEGTPLRGDFDNYLRTGEGRWKVDFRTARWAPTEENFAAVDQLAEALRSRTAKLSQADGEL